MKIKIIIAITVKIIFFYKIIPRGRNIKNINKRVSKKITLDYYSYSYSYSYSYYYGNNENIKIFKNLLK